MKSKYEEKIFDAVLLLIVGTFVVLSFNYNSTARTFPLFFGLIPFILISLNLIVGSMKNPPKFLRFIKQEGTMSDLSSKEEEQKEEAISWTQITKITLWLVFYIIALFFVHYLLATFIFLTLLLFVAGKVPLFKTLLISICFTGFLYVLFEVILFNKI